MSPSRTFRFSSRAWFCAPPLRQLFADGRDVVLGITRGHARRAPRALREIDREAPAWLLSLVVAKLRLFVLALGPPFDGILRVLGRLFEMEWVVARMERL